MSNPLRKRISTTSSSSSSSSNNILQGGNTFGADIVIGSIDNKNFYIKTNDTNRVLISSSGLTVTGLVSSTTGYYQGANKILSVSTTYGNLQVGYNTFNVDNSSATGTTAIGTSAGNSITTAVSSTFLGYLAGAMVTVGNNNTLFGWSAGFSITTGISNSAFGSNAGYGIIGGNFNTCFGANSGYDNLINGAGCSFLGYNSGTYGDYNYSIALGHSSKVRASNQLVIGGDNNIGAGGAIYEMYMGQSVCAPSAQLHSYLMTVTGVNGTGINGATGESNGSAAAAVWYNDAARGTGTGLGGRWVVRVSTGNVGTAADVQNPMVEAISVAQDTGISFSTGINTTAGDSATINKVTGRFRKDTSGSTFTLTNSLINANSIIMLTACENTTAATATMGVASGTGSAVITFYQTLLGVLTPFAPSSNMDVNFVVFN